MSSPIDSYRAKYLNIMHKYTGRNIIAYYSAFINRPSSNGIAIDEIDKMAFMQVVNGMDRSLGLDLILHTPGGSVAVTESLVSYLKSLFGNNIRVIVPQSAFSAGTMIALASKEIIMGRQSNLGPIDPQFGSASCAGIVEEFELAREDVLKNPSLVDFWGKIISKYPPAFIGDCRKTIKWAEEMVTNWLVENMLSDREDPLKDAKVIVNELSSHSSTYSHSRHIHINELLKLGVNVTPLEGLDNNSIDGCKDFQDCVLSVHHCFIFTLINTMTTKIIENNLGHKFTVSLPKPIN